MNSPPRLQALCQVLVDNLGIVKQYITPRPFVFVEQLTLGNGGNIAEFAGDGDFARLLAVFDVAPAFFRCSLG